MIKRISELINFFPLQPTREELVKLSSSFADQSNLAMTGVVIGGEKYFYLSGTDKVSILT